MFGDRQKIELLYEARIEELRERYEAQVAQFREQVIRYEMQLDAQAQDIRDLTDKALLKHGSSGIQPSKGKAEDVEPVRIEPQPMIQSAIEEDEQREQAYYENLEKQREARRREAAEVDAEDRNELLEAARAVEAQV